ncbi:uncharacterized protein LOC127129923 [Lathyrus oleraceus]|uniref:uncharacterized protein LOC127129923 n=1 Tax=Pisum sativum TaxID=3888 RepID=UPI0021D33E42|nr:uncharacterized protein LOC127129923 [Pisum sativum]
MDPLEQSHIALRGDVDSIKNQVDQLVEAMIALAKREDNIQQTAVVENAVLAPVNDPTQPQLARTPVDNSVVQERHIIRDSSYHDDVEYHSFAFSVPNSHGTSLLVNTEQPQDDEIAKRCRVLEKKLKAIEGQDTVEQSALDMCLVPGLVIPPKFKVPEFEKYKGDSCPKHHLVMFCRKMTSHAHIDKLMIHCFQDSLTGASLNWYMKLERNHVQSWIDLANAFLKQYKYNLDMAPDRMQLRALSQENNESFKGYAQRWRELAARVEPPLLDKEVMELFRDTLQSPYFERMISSAASDFAHLVSIGERIEHGLKSGKIQCASNSQSIESESIANSPKEEEVEVNAVWEAPQASHQTSFSLHGQYPTTQGPPQYQQQTPPQQPYKWQNTPHQQRQHAPQRPRKPERHIDPLPMPYSQLLPYLIKRGLIVPKEIKPVSPPYPPSFNANSRCDFHAGAQGHSTEDCKVLKSKVQNLLDSKMFSLAPRSLQINNTFSPGYGGPSVQTVEEIFENRSEDDCHISLDEQNYHHYEEG